MKIGPGGCYNRIDVIIVIELLRPPVLLTSFTYDLPNLIDPLKNPVFLKNQKKKLSLKPHFLDFLDMCGHRDPPKLGPKKFISPRKREFTKQDRPKIASPLKNFGKISFVK
mgnify:CR=1 FL=1